MKLNTWKLKRIICIRMEALMKIVKLKVSKSIDGVDETVSR